MTVIAYITGGGPLGQDQLPFAVYLPAITMALSWFLIRRNRKLVIVALGLAGLDAFCVLIPHQRFVDYWLGFYESPPWLTIAAPWVAVIVPFVAIGGIYSAKKKEPNQAPEPTAPSGRGSS